jgi:hypothetical protein
MKLTAAHLDRALAAKRLHGTPLHELLLSSGAMEGPGRPCKPLTVTLLARVQRAMRGWLANNTRIINWR